MYYNKQETENKRFFVNSVSEMHKYIKKPFILYLTNHKSIITLKEF